MSFIMTPTWLQLKDGRFNVVCLDFLMLPWTWKLSLLTATEETFYKSWTFYDASVI